MKRGMSRVSKLSDSDDNVDIIITPPLQKKLRGPMDAKRPFVEVFAGSCHLSNAFQHAGHRVYSMDIKLNIMMDISDAYGREMLVKMAKELEEETGLQPYVHFAPPCSTYSQARFPKIRSSSHPGGLPAQELTAHDRTVLKYANTVTRSTFAVMSELSDAGYMVSLEQPASRLRLRLNIFKSWAHKSGAVLVIIDYCQFGMPYRKRTAVWCAPGPLLAGLDRKCPGFSGGASMRRRSVVGIASMSAARPHLTGVRPTRRSCARNGSGCLTGLTVLTVPRLGRARLLGLVVGKVGQVACTCCVWHVPCMCGHVACCTVAWKHMLHGHARSTIGHRCLPCCGAALRHVLVGCHAVELRIDDRRRTQVSWLVHSASRASILIGNRLSMHALVMLHRA